MKELQEYKAEIFRRSALKKQQIKKRRRITFGVGVPICLCAVIGLTVMGNPHGGMEKNSAAMETIRDGNMLSENDMQIPIKTFLVADPTDADLVLSILEDSVKENATPMDGNGEDPTDGAVPEQPLADQERPEEYWLTVFSPEGGTVRYRIRGLEVFCETTGRTQWLSDTQARSLHTLLTEVAEND
jgi:hypothetical protein